MASCGANDRRGLCAVVSQTIVIRHFCALAVAAFILLNATEVSPSQASSRTDGETDRLVKAVLERSFISGEFPDIGLLPRWASIPVVADAEGLLSEAALPQLADWKFELRSREELEVAATKSAQNLYYVSVARVRIDGSVATLWVGVNFVEPSDRAPMVRMCCCGAQLKYRKVGERWMYSELVGISCA